MENAKAIEANNGTSSERKAHGHGSVGASEILARVAEWLRNERRRRASRFATQGHHAHANHIAESLSAGASKAISGQSQSKHPGGRESELSEDSLSLDELERILSEAASLSGHESNVPGEHRVEQALSRRRSRRKGSKTLARRGSANASSDTEHPDNEFWVPTAEVVLDNSKTLGYGDRCSSSQSNLLSAEKRAAREIEAWRQFKAEIMTLTHTLQIAGWKRVPIEQSPEIEVERLSGCLTNAVYVVSPPKNLALASTGSGDRAEATPLKRPPMYANSAARFHSDTNNR